MFTIAIISMSQLYPQLLETWVRTGNALQIRHWAGDIHVDVTKVYRPSIETEWGETIISKGSFLT